MYYVKRIGLLIVALIALFVGYVAMLPSKAHIERSAKIKATPEAIFAQINDFHNWDHWSPWAKLDPNAKATFEGPTAGPGAIFRWDGNDTVGTGSMEILTSKPSEQIDIKLSFIKPFEDVCATGFTLKPDGEQTVVTWTMDGERSFMQRAICCILRMDQEIGSQYEKGLASIKSIVENK